MLTTSCHVCGNNSLNTISDFQQLACVTSDVRIWPDFYQLAICSYCCVVQKLVDQHWFQSAEKIYQTYLIYHQGGGAEQAVFSPDVNGMLPRSRELVRQLFSSISIPSSGSLLDVGCGNGAFLRAFGDAAPKWHLSGTELTNNNQSTIEKINNLRHFYTGDLVSIKETFDFISMIHLLEHVPNPKKLLRECTNKLNDEGYLFIEVPGFEKNPFDLIIADHCSHFTRETIAHLLIDSGYQIQLLTEDFISKEISVIAKKTKTSPNKKAISYSVAYQLVSETTNWLHNLQQEANFLATEKNNLGLFGTSIAATWLYNSINHAVNFFVDEDPSRIGKTYLNRPIYAPSQVPELSDIFIVMPSNLAKQLRTRLMQQLNNKVNYHVPSSELKVVSV